ncbi:thioesterase, partial [Epithele typhae]|uniref:thioesterase n=1 Tax=Epithele typhae TaxID=378194 RepID=UPI00200810AB
RDAYPYSLEYRTRWIDNDQYSHINNSVYYHLFDSIVNTYLITHAHLSPSTSPLIGLVVASHARFLAPLSFPDVLDLCLRVSALGTSSVTYEVAIFAKGTDTPAVLGGYTHVFVHRDSRKSAPIAPDTRAASNGCKFRQPQARAHHCHPSRPGSNRLRIESP